MELLVFGKLLYVNHFNLLQDRTLKMAEIRTIYTKKAALVRQLFYWVVFINYKPELMAFSLSVNSLATASCWFI